MGISQGFLTTRAIKKGGDFSAQNCPHSEIPIAYTTPSWYAHTMSIRYIDLTPTTELGAMCYPCSEYKGMVDCPSCGATFCLYCEGEFGCESCGEEIVYN